MRITKFWRLASINTGIMIQPARTRYRRINNTRKAFSNIGGPGVSVTYVDTGNTPTGDAKAFKVSTDKINIFNHIEGKDVFVKANDEMFVTIKPYEGDGTIPVDPTLILHIAGDQGLVIERGSDDLSVLENSSIGSKTIIDHEGIVHNCIPGEVRYLGARRVDYADGQVYNAGVPGVRYFNTVEGGALITPSPAILHEPASTNVILQNVNMTTGWIQRNAGTVTWDLTEQAPDGSLGASLLKGVAQSDVGDIYQNITSGLPANTLLDVSFYIKKDAVAGTLRVSNSQAGSLGDWHVNWGLISDEWELITKDHPAVSVVAPFKSQVSTGASGLVFNGTTASQASFYAWGSQQEVGGFNTSTIITGATRLTRDIDDINLPLMMDGNFKQEEGILVFSTTYLSPYPLTESADGLLSTTSSILSVLYDHNQVDRFATYDGTNLANMVTSALENTPMLFSVIWDASTLKMAIGYSPDMGATWVPWGETAYKGTFQVATLISLFKGNRNRNALGFVKLFDKLEEGTVEGSKSWVENSLWS